MSSGVGGGSEVRLARLQIRNFKSFVDDTINFDPGTVLVGPNGSGKSTIVEAIRFLLSPKPGVEHRDVAGQNGDGYRLAVSVEGAFVDLTVEEERAFRRGVRTDGSIALASVESAPRVIAAPGRDSPGGGPTFRSALAIESPEPPSKTQALLDSLEGMPVQWDGRRWEGPFHALPSVVVIGDGTAAPPTVGDVVRPIALSLLERMASSGPMTEIQSLLETLGETVALRLNAALAEYRIPASSTLREIMDGDLESVLVELIGLGVTGDMASPLFNSDAAPASFGAQRASAIAALELYRQSDIWPARRAVILAIEEPEIGLHPALQRHVARTIAALPSFGVQTVITTHSPTFIDAAGPRGIRLITSPASGSNRIRESAVAEVAEALGVLPSDALLGELFLIPEGPSDAGAISVWASTLALDLERAGIRVVAAEGASKTSVLAKLISVVFEGTLVVALFDGDDEGARRAAEVKDRLGAGIEAIELRRGAIEAYLSPRAIGIWARMEATKAGKESVVLPDGTATDSLLRRIFHAVWGKSRKYSKTEHVPRIAGFMSEPEIDPEIVGILQRLLSQASRDTA